MQNSKLINFLFAFALILTSSCGHQRNAKNNSVVIDGNNQPDSMLVSHEWKGIADSEYLFVVPTKDSIVAWKTRCETINGPDNYRISNAVLVQYKDVNQYVTICDLIGVWQANNYVVDDSFTLWRIEQFRRDTINPNTLKDKFAILDNAIDSILAFEPYYKFEYDDWFYLSCRLQEFYDRLLLREAISRSDEHIAEALQKEDASWLEYQAALDSTYRVISTERHGYNGSSWGQAICGAREDNAHIREVSLVDYCFSIDEQYTSEKHTLVSEERVLNEYQHFINSIQEDEDLLPVIVRRKALKYEMSAWERWLAARNKVSSLLNGEDKASYDNSTNNIRRMKLIMLKNQYQGYGSIGNDVEKCLIPYSATDEDLDGPSFDEKWEEL